jgi:hypothetical protein
MIVTMYLRYLLGDRPRSWLQWLSSVEFCYNLSYQASIRTFGSSMARTPRRFGLTHQVKFTSLLSTTS